MGKSRKLNLSTYEMLERIAVTQYCDTDDIYMAQLNESEMKKYADKKSAVSKIVNKNKNNNKKECSTMNKNLSNKKTDEVAITKIEDTSKQTLSKEEILSKVALVTIDMQGVSQRDTSKALGNYASQVMTEIYNINSQIIENLGYKDKDKVFAELVTEYLENYDEDVLKVVIIQSLASVGQQAEVESIEQNKENLIKAIVEIHLIQQELNQKKFLLASAPSEKSLAFFHRLNDALPIELKMQEPLNAYESKKFIEFAMKLPSEAMVQRVLKLADLIESVKGKLKRSDIIELDRQSTSDLIAKLESKAKATESQLNRIASILKQLGEVYVTETYDKMSIKEANDKLNSLNKDLLIHLSKGQYSKEDIAKMDYKEVQKKISEIRIEERASYFDRDTKNRLDSIVELIGL